MLSYPYTHVISRLLLTFCLFCGDECCIPQNPKVGVCKTRSDQAGLDCPQFQLEQGAKKLNTKLMSSFSYSDYRCFPS